VLSRSDGQSASDRGTVKTREGRSATRVREERANKFMEPWRLLRRTWRFIGLIVTRAKRRRRWRARSETSVPWKYFHSGDGRAWSRRETGRRRREKKGEKAAPSEIEMSTRCGQDVEKSTDVSLPGRDLWIIHRAFEIYRTSRTRNRRKEISVEEKRKKKANGIGARSEDEVSMRVGRRRHKKNSHRWFFAWGFREDAETIRNATSYERMEAESQENGENSW